MPASEDESQRQPVSWLLPDWSKEDPGERANHTLQTTALVNETPATVKREWTWARAWPYHKLSGP